MAARRRVNSETGKRKAFEQPATRKGRKDWQSPRAGAAGGDTPSGRVGRRYAPAAGAPCPGKKPTSRCLLAEFRFCPINSLRIHDRIPSVLGDTYPADWLFTNAVFSTLRRCRIASGTCLGWPSLGKQQAGKRSPNHTISQEARTERIQSLTRDLRTEIPPVWGVPYQKGTGNVDVTRQAVVSQSEKTGSP